jgi:hypothetical protein
MSPLSVSVPEPCWPCVQWLNADRVRARALLPLLGQVTLFPAALRKLLFSHLHKPAQGCKQTAGRLTSLPVKSKQHYPWSLSTSKQTRSLERGLSPPTDNKSAAESTGPFIPRSLAVHTRPSSRSAAIKQPHQAKPNTTHHTSTRRDSIAPSPNDQVRPIAPKLYLQHSRSRSHRTTAPTRRHPTRTCDRQTPRPIPHTTTPIPSTHGNVAVNTAHNGGTEIATRD